MLRAHGAVFTRWAANSNNARKLYAYESQIPAVALPGGAGKVCLIAGSYADEKGPARTFTPITFATPR